MFLVNSAILAQHPFSFFEIIEQEASCKVYFK